MKRPIVALVILGLAAPTAWGLYATNAPVPPAEFPQPAPAVSAENPPLAGEPRAWPLMGELGRINEIVIGLKRRINAYITRDSRAATRAWAEKCLPAVGGGNYAHVSSITGRDVTEVSGEIYKVAGAPEPLTRFRVHLYDSAGKLLASATAEVADLREGTARTFRTVLHVPRRVAAKARLEYEPPPES